MGTFPSVAGGFNPPAHIPVGTNALDSATDLGNLNIGSKTNPNRVNNMNLLFNNILDLSGGGATTWLAVGAGNTLLTTRQMSNAADEAAGATAGGGAAPPATVAGYLIRAKSDGTVIKVPYYLN